MSVRLDSWYDELAINVPGAPLPALELALQRTLAEFLRCSGAYAKEVPGIALRAGRDTYTIPRQPEGPILFLYGLTYENRPLRVVLAEEWQVTQPASGSAPTSFRRYTEDPYRLTISPAPAADMPSLLVPYVAFGYSAACQDHLLDVFGTHWYDAILHGAIFRLCSQPGKPYTDATVAALHGRLFRSEISKARDQARKQFTKTDTPFQFPLWA